MAWTKLFCHPFRRPPLFSGPPLLLKQAGLEPQDVLAQQLTVVANTLLREALRKNGVADAEPTIRQWLDYCAKQAEALRTSERLRVSNTVEEVFTRMGLRRS